jgi:FAD/FMN-containing dehydrogenase
MTLQHLLGEIVGAANVLTASEDTKPYYTDWRRQYHAAAECVVRPASTAEVAAVVALCAWEGVGQGQVHGLGAELAGGHAEPDALLRDAQADDGA